MNNSKKLKFLWINLIWFFLISPTLITGLPDEIAIDFQQSIYMKYTLDQTYNERDDPTNYLNARSIIYNNITFDTNYRWVVKSTFQIDVLLSTCYIYPYIADFKYIFSNTTKQIQVVIESHGNWPLLNKHPSFYSGINPDNNEPFLLDEMMLLREEDGIFEMYFNKLGTGNITLDKKTYDTNIFELNTSFSIAYYGWASYMIDYDFYALHYYDINSGILLYSNVSIFETGNGKWANHTFIRQLTEYTDFSDVSNNQPNFFDNLAEFLRDSALPLSILAIIILGTFLSIRIIHQNNLKRRLEEFKRIQRTEKLPSKQISDKKLKSK